MTNRKLYRLAALVLAIAGAGLISLIGGGCVAPVAKISSTGSGKPEVVVVTKDIGRIKSLVIGHLINQGFVLERESDFMLEMSQPATGAMAMTAALSIGNSYSTNRVVATYTFVKTEEGIRIICALTLRAQLPGGQVNTMAVGNDGNTYNAVQTGLYDMKTRIEAADKK